MCLLVFLRLLLTEGRGYYDTETRPLGLQALVVGFCEDSACMEIHQVHPSGELQQQWAAAIGKQQGNDIAQHIWPSCSSLLTLCFFQSMLTQRS